MDEKREQDTEGHMPVRWKAADTAPDEPGGPDAEGHMPVKWRAREESPDEPQQGDDGDKPGPDEGFRYKG